MNTAEEILDQALQLPRENRAMLAAELLRSLHPPGDDLTEAEWAAAWMPEFERRALAYEQGKTIAVDWRVSLERTRKALHEGSEL